MKKISLLSFLVISLQALILSVGGFEVQKYPSLYSFHSQTPPKETLCITQLLKKQSPNVNGITMWITKDWQESWYDKDTIQKEIIAKGYTPIFIFYYFADAISIEYVKKNLEDYYLHLQRFLDFLQSIDGEKIVILNPEYNMQGVGSWSGMDDIFYKSIQMIHKDPQAIVGPCVGDFGNYTYTNEPKEWKLFDPSLQKSSKIADFIAFQEMRALTRNKKSEILKTPQRAYHLAKYLYKTYHKPTILAYLAISSYKDKQLQADVYKGFLKYLPKMQKEALLFSFGIFHYFDYPHHQGFFKEAEEFFGVVTKDNIKKPSFYYFNRLHHP